jgi:hypothetical protein
MAIEIGSLVVRGAFRAEGAEERAPSEQAMQDELARLRQSILEDVRDMLAEAERRRTDR